MTLLLIVSLFMGAAFTHAQNLTCQSGIDVQFPPFLSINNITNGNLCLNLSAARCLIIEASLDGSFQGSQVRIPAMAASCATEDICNQECKALVRNFTAGISISGMEIDYNISSCAKACCDGNNCNSDSVADILAGQATMETTTPDGAPSNLQNNFLVFLLTVLPIVLHNAIA